MGTTGGGVWYDQTPDEFRARVFDPNVNEIFGERYTYAQVNWIINSFLNIFSLKITDINQFNKIIQDLMSQSEPSVKSYAQLGIPGLLIGSMAEAYAHPPASGVNYINEGLAHLQIVPSAHAQGVGFNSISVFQTLWKASRNSAYLLAVVLLIAAGFAIMFRVKINPQTIVSLQVMIPKLIITLVLITFSFAIAGLVIDLIYVVISLFIASLQFGVISPDVVPQAIRLFTSSSYNWVWLYYFVPLLLFFSVGTLVGVGGFAILPWAGAIPGAAIALLALFITIMVLVTLFRVWWMLVKAYLTLMMLIIIGPWQIMLDLIPGQSGFTSWFRNVVANASVFVVVPIMFIFNMIFWRSIFATWLFNPAIMALVPSLAPLGQINTGLDALSGNFPNLPVIGGQGFIFQFAIGFAILSIIPKVADMVRDALKVPAFKYGTGLGDIGSAVVTGSKLVTAGVRIGKDMSVVGNVAGGRGAPPERARAVPGRQTEQTAKGTEN